MRITNIFLLLIVFFFSCSKEDNSVPSSPSSSGQGTSPTTTLTNFIYTGTMLVTKYDSSWNAVSNYPLSNVNSKMVGISPSYVLSTTFDASSLKGIANSLIPINIQNNYFTEYTGGSGIFIDGVTNGYNTKDSLFYRVLYKDVAKNNIYLDYSGKLSSSY